MTGTPLIPAAAVPVAHGYTLADAERIAGRAARDHPSSLLSHADRHFVKPERHAADVEARVLKWQLSRVGYAERHIPAVSLSTSDAEH